MNTHVSFFPNSRVTVVVADSAGRVIFTGRPVEGQSVKIVQELGKPTVMTCTVTDLSAQIRSTP